jgi:hypothetical protein
VGAGHDHRAGEVRGEERRLLVQGPRQFPLKDFQGKSPEINHAKSMLGERLDRLLVIIRRVEGIG